MVQIAHVLEGRSEGVETLHYISSAHVKENAGTTSRGSRKK